MKATDWYISSTVYSDYNQTKPISYTVSEGMNSDGDGPDREVGKFKSVRDAQMICILHNKGGEKCM